MPMFPHNAHRSHKLLALLYSAFNVAIIFSAIFLFTSTPASAASVHIDVTVFNSEVNPASLHSLTRAIDTAVQDGAQALVIEIDTPGGDIESMKSMVQAELASKVPLIAYVSPTGGRAASAGAFITLAAHITAMAPATRIGASSPVTETGGNIESTLQAKIENDLVASITGIQKRYNRNVPLATAMVTNARSYDDQTAAQDHLVDIGADGAPNLSVLLNTINGRAVTLDSGQTLYLQTAGAEVKMLNAGIVDQFYSLLLDPNIIFLLFVVAMIGIYLEISHPGTILPGVAGAIALLLFLFAVGSLTPNWAGLALMVLAFVLLVLDVRLPTHGVLTIGAVVSLIVGSLLFFNSGGPYSGPQINPLIVYLMSAVIGAIGLTLVAFVVRAQRKPVSTGIEGMVGASVTALTPLVPEGRVCYAGEDWAAILDPPALSADEGSVLQIVSVERLRLHVRHIRTQAMVDRLPISVLE